MQLPRENFKYVGYFRREGVSAWDIGCNWPARVFILGWLTGLIGRGAYIVPSSTCCHHSYRAKESAPFSLIFLIVVGDDERFL